ncbi:MAG: hypothetical protein RLZZ175_2773 [Bacteroidota bacterium]|jgi:type I restriction-modification system DNA methylase subunit
MLKITNSAQLKSILSKYIDASFLKVTVLKRDTPKELTANNDFYAKVEIVNSTSSFFDNTSILKMPFSQWQKLVNERGAEIVNVQAQSVTPIVKTVNTKVARNLSIYENIQALVDEKGWYDGTPESISKYTKEDIEILKKYEGRGGLKGVAQDLNSTGALNEFYTPEPIANMMYRIALLNGFKGGKILEPSVGVGRLIKYFYVDAENSIVAFEKDKVSATICKLLYPLIKLSVKSFESQFYTGNVHTHTRAIAVANYDLVIGNPPYEKTGGYYIKEYESVGATQFDQYFLSRGLDLLKSGGLLVMIIPSTFLRNERLYNPIKEQIAEKADLVQAFRLPNDVFPNTGVGTDIVCFRKK